MAFASSSASSMSLAIEGVYNNDQWGVFCHAKLESGELVSIMVIYGPVTRLGMALPWAPVEILVDTLRWGGLKKGESVLRWDIRSDENALRIGCLPLARRSSKPASPLDCLIDYFQPCRSLADLRRRCNDLVTLELPDELKSEGPDPGRLDAVFGIVADYGEDTLTCGQAPVKPLSRLRRSKTEIKAAIFELLDVLSTPEGQAMVKRRYEPGFAGYATSQEYQTTLQNGLLRLSEFVPDADAALCHWEWTLLQEAEGTGDLMRTLEISPEQYERIRQLRLAISAEKASLFEELRSRPRPAAFSSGKSP
jgi:hypothetical protein